MNVSRSILHVFDIADAGDHLYIWDGADTTTGQFIGGFNSPFGSNDNNLILLYPDGIQSTSGCFTFYFHSDSDFITGDRMGSQYFVLFSLRKL